MVAASRARLRQRESCFSMIDSTNTPDQIPQLTMALDPSSDRRIATALMTAKRTPVLYAMKLPALGHAG